MAVTQEPVGPPPGSGGPIPTWDVAQPAEAGTLSRGLVLVTVASALWLITAVAEAAHVGLLASAVLAASVAVGIATGAHRAFRAFPGMVVALLVFLALLFLSSLLIPNVPDRWGLLLVCLPLIPVGLDWLRVGRLQGTIVVAAFLVIPTAAAERSGSLVVTLGWFALAAASLWSLEQDRRRGEDRPQPLVPGTGLTDPHPGDLLRTVALAVGVGLLAALLLSVPSCNLDLSLPGNGSSGSGRIEPGEPGDPGSGEPRPIEPGSDRPGTGEPGGSTSPAGDQDGAGDRDPERPSPPRFSPWWLLVVVALAAALAWYLWRRSRTPPMPMPDREWALALVEQIDRAGRDRGLPRPESSTVLQYTDELASSVLPDEQLRAVGRLLNDALFGRIAIDAHTRMWAQTVVDEIIEVHPVEGRTRR